VARCRAAEFKPRLKEALERLVQLYDETTRPAQTAEWKQKLAEFESEAETKAAVPKP
jgi:hypothetical protein